MSALMAAINVSTSTGRSSWDGRHRVQAEAQWTESDEQHFLDDLIGPRMDAPTT